MGNSVSTFAQRANGTILRSEKLFNRLTPTISDAGKQLIGFGAAGAIATGAAFSGKAIMDYEDSVQSFRTIVSDLNDTQFSAYERKIGEVAKLTKKSSIDVAKGFEMIAGLNADFAKTPEAIGKVTAAAITLSKASKDELGKSASNLTGILNQFSLSANEADRVINVLAAGQAVGASSITQTADAFTVFGAVAKSANLSVEQSTALVEVLASKQIQGAEAGTALRGTLLALQKAGLGYKTGVFNIRDAIVEVNQKLAKKKTAMEKDAYMTDVFGVINRTTGTILTQSVDAYDKFTQGVSGTSEAQKAAAINTNSLSSKVSELSAKWVTLITTSDKSKTSLTGVKSVVGFLADNLETIVMWGGRLLMFFAAWKTALIIGKALITGYNIVLGIQGALTGVASVAIGKSSIAMGAYNLATKAVTAAQWLWNAALMANPIGLIILGVTALIGLIVAIVAKWNEWGAAVSLFLGPIGMVISIIQSFRRNWDMVVEAFSKGGILAGIKAIGKVLLDAVLMPVQQLMGIIGKLTGWKWAEEAVSGIEKFRKALGVNVTTDESGDKLAPTTRAGQIQAQADANSQRSNEVNGTIKIMDHTGKAQVDPDSSPWIQLMPQISSTTKGVFSPQVQ
jgi:TP901 family phage tail tape measure protein